MTEDCSTDVNILAARCAELESRLAAAKSNTALSQTGRDRTIEARISVKTANGGLGHRVEDQTSVSRRRTFTEVFLNHSGYLADKWAQFLPVYDFELQPMIARGRPLRLLVIGVQNGGSLQIWHEYLPEGSQIYGLDIDERCRRLEFPPQIKVLIGDAGDPVMLNQLLGDEVFDIIIDDGSHQSKDVIAAVEALLPRLAAGGKYFIEDLHASYWSPYGGGFRSAGTAIEHVKKFVDALHSDYFQASDSIEDGERRTLTDLNAQIGRVSFYDSIAVIASYSRPKITCFNRVVSGREIRVTGVDYLLDVVAAHQNEFTLSGGATDVVVSAAARKVFGLRQETHRLRADIEQRAMTEAALRADIEQRAVTEAALRADIEQRAVTEAALRKAVDQAEREAEYWEAKAEALERDACEHATAAEVLLGEIASLRAQLAVSQRDLRERTAAAEALRGEITSSRIQVAAAERDVGERATAAEALRDELSSARSELAAAHDVGRAALASLKSEAAMIPEAPRNVAWLTSVLRFLGLRMRVFADADTL